jgi:hypothetical protein
LVLLWVDAFDALDALDVFCLLKEKEVGGQERDVRQPLPRWSSTPNNCVMMDINLVGNIESKQLDTSVFPI